MKAVPNQITQPEGHHKKRKLQINIPLNIDEKTKNTNQQIQ